jgi:hypothetical protein
MQKFGDVMQEIGPPANVPRAHEFRNFRTANAVYICDFISRKDGIKAVKQANAFVG